MNFAAEEPDLPQGCGHGETLVTDHMVTYQNQQTKTHQSTQKRAQRLAVHQLQAHTMPTFTSQVPTPAMPAFGWQAPTYEFAPSPSPQNMSTVSHMPIGSHNMPSTGFRPFQLFAPNKAGPLDAATLAELQELVDDPDAINDEDSSLATTQESICDDDYIAQNDIQSVTTPTPQTKKILRHVDANGLTPISSVAISSVGGRLTHRMHRIPPEVSAMTALDKENNDPTAQKHLADQMEGFGSSDDEQMKPKCAKKKASLRLSSLTTGQWELTEGAFPIFVQLILQADPWAFKGDAKVFVVVAFNARQDYLIMHCNYKGKVEPTEYELELIQARQVQHRSELKTLARRWVSSSSNGLYRFRDPIKEEEKEYNHDLVARLKENNAFVFKNPSDISLPKSLFRCSFIQGILNDEYFSAGSRSLGLRDGFFPNGEIPLTVIALIAVAIECAIDEWHTGVMVKLKFEKDIYKAQYMDHLQALQDWDAYSKKSGSLATQKLQKEMFEAGKAHTSVSDEVEEMTIPAMFTEARFAADEA
ncbi:hypothetical protein EDD18DRAFT_1339165 [Armillaria luteobubalina]|uniref:DUF6532 domain-containing protein n=1 Tax=Armillaria luteobubalina TaxID=153913 RepID=A0AA39NZC0_9AGAR|nr:hypothetical protein EDD18DRAFT_1339165 [Armillaria luteobubalina]